MLFILYCIGKFLALHLPLKASYGIAWLTGVSYCAFSEKDRDAVKDNMKVLFPDYREEKIDHMVKEIFINFGKYLVDFFRFSMIDADYINKYVKVEGVENLRQAMEGKKGAIILTAHLGNFELGGVVIASLGFPLNAIALAHRDKQINRFFIDQRRIKGVNVIPIGAALKKCFAVLVSNEVLALLGDRDYYDHGIKLDFFGKPTMIPKGPAAFSSRCGSPIIPTFMTRNEDDTYTIKFHKAIEARSTGDKDQDLIITTKEIVTVLEQVIKQHPTQWYVFRRFWQKIGWGKQP